MTRPTPGATIEAMAHDLIPETLCWLRARGVAERPVAACPPGSVARNAAKAPANDYSSNPDTRRQMAISPLKAPRLDPFGLDPPMAPR